MYSKKIQSIANYIADIHKVNLHPNCKNYKILDNWSKIALMLFKIGSIVIATAAITFMLFPVFGYLLTGEIEMMLPVYNPFIDINSKHGFYIVMAFHVCILIMGIIGIVGVDLAIFLFIVYTHPIADLFCNAIKRLNVRVNATRPNPVLIHFSVRNIVMMHQELSL